MALGGYVEVGLASNAGLGRPFDGGLIPGAMVGAGTDWLDDVRTGTISFAGSAMPAAVVVLLITCPLLIVPLLTAIRTRL